MKNNQLPVVIPKYIIKENNPAYGYGEGNGWIYCTNFIRNYFHAKILAVALDRLKGFKHEVINVSI